MHATDPVLRHFLLGSPKTIRGDLMERLRRLADAGIRLHTQIVLCPGLNDGPHLERTVRELGELHPGVATVAVVPVGLTRHRDGLYPLRSITPAEAGATLDAIHAWQADFLARHGHAARLRARTSCTSRPAGRSRPPRRTRASPSSRTGSASCGGSRTISGGWPRRPGRPRWRGARVATVVTGELFAPILGRLLGEAARARASGPRSCRCRTSSSGRAITVAGLLTGQDVARALSGRSLGDAVLVPRVALTETKGVFLDDVAPDDLARHLGVPVVSRRGQRPRTRRRPARPAARAGREASVPVRLPVVAIVGRPNVGKSTLFNRLIGSRKAIVRDTPGVTRDRIHGTCEFGGWRATVIDTGGLDPTSDEPLTAQVRKQVLAAIAEADALVFVVDGREGLTRARRGGRAAAPARGQARAGRRQQGRRQGAARRRRPTSTAWGWSRCCRSRPSTGAGWPS